MAKKKLYTPSQTTHGDQEEKEGKLELEVYGQNLWFLFF